MCGIDQRTDRRVAQLRSVGDFEFRQANMQVKEEVDGAFTAPVDMVYHLAGQPAVWFANANPRDDCMVNVLGTVNLLERMRQVGARRIVFASTGDVYRDTYLPSEDSPLEPANFYGLSKSVAEGYIRLYSRLFAMRYTILRLSVVFGPGLVRNVLFDIIAAFARSKPLRLPMSLDSEYDFVFIDDVVSAMLHATADSWANKTLNISSGAGVKVRDIVEYAATISNVDASRVQVAGDTIVRKVYRNDTAIALGWRPRQPFLEGVKKCWDYEATRATGEDREG